MLHETHPEMIRMKDFARSYMWWPGLNEDIEETVQQCNKCPKQHREEPATPLHSLEVTTGPWQRVHNDFAGPFKG